MIEKLISYFLFSLLLTWEVGSNLLVAFLIYLSLKIFFNNWSGSTIYSFIIGSTTFLSSFYCSTYLMSRLAITEEKIIKNWNKIHP